MKIFRRTYNIVESPVFGSEEDLSCFWIVKRTYFHKWLLWLSIIGQQEMEVGDEVYDTPFISFEAAEKFIKDIKK